jgi:thioredoxin-related protein
MSVWRFILAFLLISSISYGQEFISYKDGYKAYMENKEPLVVFITTDGCVHCEKMKKDILPLFKKVVKLQDGKDNELIMKLTNEVKFPQLITYYQDKDKVFIEKIVGYKISLIDKVKNLLVRIKNRVIN